MFMMMMAIFFFFSMMFFFFDFFFFFFFLFFFFFFFFFGSMTINDGYFILDYVGINLCFITLWVFFVSIFFFLDSKSGLLFYWSMGYFIFLSFSCSSLLFFYIFFEFSFVFMFYFLLNWGKSMERIQASYYMFFYTMLFSFPFLLFLLDFISYYSTFFFFFSFYDLIYLFWVFTFFVFLVKLPVFGVHVWLPKAHVEAPVSGSMLLAGVLLKLGGYGLFRFFFLLKHINFSYFFFTFIFYLAILGSIICSIICYRTSDIKMIIAYSSVVHMGSMLAGLMSFSFSGAVGSVLMMVSHGFISPLMFFLLNSMYTVIGSRSVFMLKGFFFINSLFCMFWFLSCFLNLGLPPFMSFFSEIFIFGSMGFLGGLEMCVLFFILFFSGVYSVFLFILPFHGMPIFFSSFLFPNYSLLLSFSVSFYVVFFSFVYFVPFF